MRTPARTLRWTRTALLLFLLLAAPAQAAFFVVDTSADAVDATPGDGACATSLGDCTLRAAVMEANALPGFDKVLVATDVVLSMPSPSSSEETDASLGDLDIAEDLALFGLRGSGGTPPLLDAASQSRHFHVLPGARVLALSLRLEGGWTPFGTRGGAFQVDDGGTLWLSRSELRNNRATIGGAVHNQGKASIDECHFEGNSGSGEDGSAIFSSGELHLKESTIVDSFAEDGVLANTGHALVEESTISGNYGEDPGGILNIDDGEMTILRSTVSGNIGDEGGILNFGKLTIIDSTISGNVGEFGTGGIDSPGPLLLIASTVVDNVAVDMYAGRGGVSGGRLGDIVVQASIIAGNTNAGLPSDCSIRGTSLGYNVVGRGCAAFDHPTDLVGSVDDPVDPLLGPLADNGGPTETHHPLEGSPAIDAIPPDRCRFDLDGDPTTRPRRLLTDQRGVPRFRACDLGSVEVAPGRCGRGFALALAVPAFAWARRPRSSRT